MRNSQIAMLAALGAVILAIVVVIGIARIVLFDSNSDFEPGGREGSRRARTDISTVSRELTGFDGFDVFVRAWGEVAFGTNIRTKVAVSGMRLIPEEVVEETGTKDALK